MSIGDDILNPYLKYRRLRERGENMELKVRNFAKIAEADIIIDGITVIAGNNNTGKSTIGKILDVIFNTTNNISAKMNKARIDSLNDMLQKELEQILVKENFHLIGEADSKRITIRRMSDELIKGRLQIEEICEKYLAELGISLDESEERQVIAKIKGLLEEIDQISEETLSQAIYTQYFGEVFHKQVNSLYQRDKEADITLSIKGNNIRLTFEKDTCIRSIREVAISNTSIYIDDPFVLDELNNVFSFLTVEGSLHKKNIIEKLREKKEKAVEEKVLSELLMNKRLEDIMDLMDRVVSGNVLKRQRYMYQIDGNISTELDISSLSTGLKAFVIIKQLLLNGVLNEKDVIVLDEPEIHLHPEWQLIYAEIIVLLQKKFNFHIIVTTHSSHFMEALELYSKKYDIEERCNYYLAYNKENETGAYFENVTRNLSKIYKQLVDPTLLLSRLREELENKDDEL